MTIASQTFHGTDNDPVAAWLGSAVLAAELLPLWARLPEPARARLPQLVKVGDGLEVGDDQADLVVMNPPYGRVTLDAAARRRWAATLHGHANWYAVFLHAAVERTAPDGLLGAVLPSSFLAGAYFQRLRAFLAERAPLVRLRRIDDRTGVFATGVLQETCLAVFRKGEARRSVFVSAQRVNGRVRSLSLGRSELPDAEPSLPWIFPRGRDDRSLVRAAVAHPARLRDFGWRASTGPLVWNRHKPQISSRRTRTAVPIVWAADVRAGQVRRSSTREAQRWIRLRKRDEFMRLRDAVVLVQRTTAPEQPRRLVAAPFSPSQMEPEWGGAVVVENHVNVLRCERVDSPLSVELLSRLLNTNTFDRLYRCMAGTVAVSAYELESLALPGSEVLGAWTALSGQALEDAVAEAFR